MNLTENKDGVVIPTQILMTPRNLKAQNFDYS